MRCVILSDLHIHSWAAFGQLNQDGINKRLAHSLDCLQQVFDIAVALKVECVLFCGDLFHVRKIDVEVYDLAYRKFDDFSKSGIPFLAIPGNHDQALKNLSLNSIRPFSKVLHIMDEPLKIGNSRIHGIEYQRNKKDLIEKMKAAPASDLLMIHSGIAGAAASAFYIAPEEENLTLEEINQFKEKFGIIIAGHFHNPHYLKINESGAAAKWRFPTGVKFDVKQGDVIIPGSPMQHNFGDSGMPRGCWVLDTSKWKAEFIKLDLPQFVSVDASELAQKVDKLANNYVLLKIPDSINQKHVDDLSRELSEICLGFSIERYATIAKESKRIEVSPGQSFGEMLGNFVDVKAPTDLDKDRLKKIGLEIMRENEVLKT